ncbi:hypothetical protein CYLTODRAFT_425055 [Cylindrobasidium torrendii FP15055 ss-10]|uniref:Secreted protein n=1 Tax=Cylindrobasidium torrendii FP15055 ss-10 TaxID=1314674 RepID=A0A0D7B349_9AGAR|nr:hypothetical protein CYLTODRAFT_425055 [Cylindrobasidium torrendii FP15055 ss-10]
MLAKVHCVWMSAACSPVGCQCTLSAWPYLFLRTLSMHDHGHRFQLLLEADAWRPAEVNCESQDDAQKDERYRGMPEAVSGGRVGRRMIPKAICERLCGGDATKNDANETV